MVTDTHYLVSYDGRGDTGPYAIDFDVQLDSGGNAKDIKVYAVVKATGVKTDITSTSTISGLNVTTALTYGATYDVILVRDPAATQPYALPYGNKLPAKTIEAALDRLAFLAQKVLLQTERSLRFPISDTVITDLPTKADLAGKVIGLNADATALIGVAGVPSAPATAAAATVLDDETVGDMLTTLGLSAFVKTLIDDADASAAQTTLGISAFIKTLLDAANVEVALVTLGFTNGIPYEYLTVTATPYAPTTFTRNLTVIYCDMATALAVDISAGAIRAGQRVIIANKNVGLVTLTVTAGAATAPLGLGDSLTLMWNGANWQYVASTNLRWIFTDGTAVSWTSPWTGSYVVRAQGGGGNGGNVAASTGSGGGGGGGGGCPVKKYNLGAGTVCTYTAGAAAAASTFTDGTTIITGAAGVGGGPGHAAGAHGAPGGAALNGDLNIPGSGGGSGSSGAHSGSGGDSHLGAGGPGRGGALSAGIGGGLYGGGGSGASEDGSGVAQTGGVGAAGVVIIEAAGGVA